MCVCVCDVCELSMQGSVTGPRPAVSSTLDEADHDVKLQFEQSAYECLGKCWPPTSADTQGMIDTHCLSLSVYL